MQLILSNICKEYPTPQEPLTILRNVNLTMHSGESLAITGPSGSGKSTLLHILGTLDLPTSGSLRFDDVDPKSLSERELALFRNRQIGFVFQDHHLLPQCNVLENVLVPTLARSDRNPDQDTERALMLIERVGLSARREHRPAALSGGERQRVSVARSLIMNPALVLADEPTGNLDRQNALWIGELLQFLPQEENIILVVVTHSLELASRFSRHLEMVDGQLVEHTSRPEPSATT